MIINQNLPTMKDPTWTNQFRTALATLTILLATFGSAQTVFINEIHYDDASTDSGEGVEIAGPAGTNLTGWTIIPYNGSNGQAYTPSGAPTATIPDLLGSGFGVVFVPISGLQNGAPDGLALVNPSNVVVQLLSYEGSFTATNGIANGMTSVDIGVSEPGNIEGQSLQLTGTGTVYTDFTWVAQATSTYDAFNNGQTFGGAACGISLDPEFADCNTVTVGPGDTYDLSIPYTGTDAGTTVVNNGASGTIGGDDPATVPNGTVVITGIDEADGYNVTFTAPCDAFVVSGSAPICEPVTTTALVVNEIHADPDATLGDANGDGAVNTSDDEFVEMVNTGGVDEDISGWSLSDSFGVRHVFPNGTVVPAGCGIVIFGGGTPTGVFGGAVVQVATGGTVGLNNAGDDIILKDPLDQVVFTVTYGAAGNNQSINLDPEIIGASYVDHSTIPAAASALFSPGTLVDGSTFSGCTLPACAITLSAESTNCITFTAGNTDTYDLSIPYNGIEVGTSVVNNSGSGTIGGDDPAVTPNGTIVISGISEADNYNVTFSTPCNALTVSGSAPSCDPPACALTLDPESAICNSITAGPTDTYDLSISYTGLEAGTSVINNSGSGTVGGDDPALVANGTIVISGISETDAYSIAFDVPCETLTVSGAAPNCEPVPTLTIINFDEATNWTAGAVALTSYATDHTYVESGWGFTGGGALRNGTALQDLIPGALDVYSWRMQNVAGVDWRATYNGTATLTQFGFDVRRWDGVPSPAFDVSYSTNGGTTFSAAILTINNAYLDESSAWKTFNYAIPSPTQLAPGNLIVRVFSTGATERIMIDNFSFDTGAVACALSLGSPSVACDSFTAGAGSDTYTVTINYTGMQSGTSVINNSGSGTVGGDDPAIVGNGTITVSGITEGTGYNIGFDVPCETLVVSGSSPVCEPPPTLVINEINYDETGTDVDEFVEIKNTGASSVDLNGMKLILVNGSTGSPYVTVVLNNVMLAAGDYYVVGNSGVANLDQVGWASNTMQNGAPDGVLLTTSGDLVIDQMSYEGDMSTTEGTGAGTDPGDEIGVGLSRIPDGVDTNDNSVDFVLACSSPGTANTFDDADSDGTPDCIDQCPGGPEPFSACDDLNANTSNDIVQLDCSCAGIANDCNGVPGGPDVPGAPCDDLDPNTVNDTYQPNCSCVGQIIDCLGTPGGPALPGTPCFDFNPNTFNDVYDAFCVCSGGPCTEDLLLQIDPGTEGSQIGWEITTPTDASVICGVAPGTYLNDPSGSPIVEPCCLGVGCYRLSVFDSAGDGIAGGGYQLREIGANGRRIIDNTGNFPAIFESSVSGSEDFCVPISDDELIWSSCDKMDWVNYKYLVTHANAAVSAEWIPNGANNVQDANSGYEFWIFDPNGTYSYRRFRSHNVSDGKSPANATRACHMKINGWYNSGLTPLIPQNTLLNVRVRGRVNGVNGAFGPACRMKMDAARAACPFVKLQDDPANTSDYSCGVTRSFGGTNTSANMLVALPPQFQPAPLAGGSGVRFQFRFRIPGEQFCLVRPPQTSPTLYLNWTNAPALEATKTYEVEVRVSKDQGATWCVDGANPACDPDPVTAWGKTCSVTISSVNVQSGTSNMQGAGGSTLTLYPNPNRGDQLFLSLSNVAATTRTIAVELFDLTGKRAIMRTIPVNEGMLNTVLPLNGELAKGIYLVQVTEGTNRYTERLVVQ